MRMSLTTEKPSTKNLTTFSPFNLRTDKIGKRAADVTFEQEDTSFRAKKMPKYTFFKIADSVKRQIEFREFNLTSNSR